jgi:hypothetical protein
MYKNMKFLQKLSNISPFGGGKNGLDHLHYASTMRKYIKKKRRTRKKNIYGGVRKKKRPTIKCPIRVPKIIKKTVRFRIRPMKKLLRRAAKNPKISIPENILLQLLEDTTLISFVSEESLYAIVERVILENPIIIGNESTNQCIMKLCLISPTPVVFQGSGGLSKKVSYSKRTLDYEFARLSVNSQFSICPMPLAKNIFHDSDISSVFKLLDAKIPQDDRNVLPSLRQLWRNLQVLKKLEASNRKEVAEESNRKKVAEESNRKEVAEESNKKKVAEDSREHGLGEYGLGIILMENIPGESAQAEIDKETDDNKNYAILIKILYKLILLYVNGFIHLDCHLNNIIMKPLSEEHSDEECLLQYPEGDIKEKIAIALSEYNKTAVLIDFGDVEEFETVFPLQEPIEIALDSESREDGVNSIIAILKQIMELPQYEGWFTFLYRPILDVLIMHQRHIFEVLYDYCIENIYF